MASFASLPLDVLQLIFSYLPEELLICSRVCQAWRKWVRGIRVLKGPRMLRPGAMRALCSVMPQLTYLDVILSTHEVEAVQQITQLSCLTRLQILAQKLPSTVLVDLARLPSLTSLTLRCRVPPWDCIPVRTSLHLFKQLKELSISGLKLNKNTHVYLWQHKSEYALLEWEQLMMNEPSAAFVEERYQSIVQEFRTTERTFLASLDAMVAILDDLLASKRIKQDLYKVLLLGNHPALCTLGAEFLRDLEVMAPCFAFARHKAYLMALAEESLRYTEKRRVLDAYPARQALDVATRQHPKSRSLDLVSFLMMPRSRIPRYMLLFQDLLQFVELEQVEESYKVSDELQELYQVFSIQLLEQQRADEATTGNEKCILS